MTSGIAAISLLVAVGLGHRETSVATAPLVRNPVRVASGAVGTLWVVDRDDPFDSLLRLHDEDGDGAMDSSGRFLSNLVGVRGVVPIAPNRALVLEPPQLLDAEDMDGDGHADRVDVVARGLDGARDLAGRVDDSGAWTLLVAGTGAEVRFDGTSAAVVSAAFGLDADGVAYASDGRPIVVAGSLVTIGRARVPIGLAPCSDVVETTAGLVGMAAHGRDLVRPAPVGERWAFAQPTPPAQIWSAAAADGAIEAIDVRGESEVLVALGATAQGAGRIVAVAIEPSTPIAPSGARVSAIPPDERRISLDRELASHDGVRCRAVVERALAEGDEVVIERLAAAVRLNGRRPGRLALDRAPVGFDVGALGSLHPALQRVVRRLSWPGRDDGAMDPEPVPSLADVVERGRRLYSNCLTCHGVTGRGQPGVYPPLVGTEYVLGDPERLARIVLHGLEGPIAIDGRPFSGTMPPPPMRGDEDIAAVLTYVRQAFGNDAEPISPEVVARVRRQHASRRNAWTMPELDAIKSADPPAAP